MDKSSRPARDHKVRVEYTAFDRDMVKAVEKGHVDFNMADGAEFLNAKVCSVDKYFIEIEYPHQGKLWINKAMLTSARRVN